MDTCAKHFKTVMEESFTWVIWFLLEKQKFSENLPFQKSSLQTAFLPIVLSSEQISQSETGKKVSSMSST